MIGKMMVMVCAVMGAFFIVPHYFPTMQHVAFHLNQIGIESTLGITYSMLFTLMIFVFASGLQAKG